MATDKAFPALRNTLTARMRTIDPKAMREIRSALDRAERLAESRLRTIKRLLAKLRACRVEGRKLAARVERLEGLLEAARHVLRESQALAESRNEILEAERRKRLEAEQALDECRRRLDECRPPETDGRVGGLLSKLGK